MQFILGLILALISSSLVISFYLYLIYVIPFINGLDRKNLLKPNNTIKKQVLVGGFISLMVGLIIGILVYHFGGQQMTKWFTVWSLTFIIISFADTHIFKKFGKENKKFKTISNFKENIQKSLHNKEDYDIEFNSQLKSK